VPIKCFAEVRRASRHNQVTAVSGRSRQSRLAGRRGGRRERSVKPEIVRAAARPASAPSRDTNDGGKREQQAKRVGTSGMATSSLSAGAAVPLSVKRVAGGLLGTAMMVRTAFGQD